MQDSIILINQFISLFNFQRIKLFISISGTEFIKINSSENSSVRMLYYIFIWSHFYIFSFLRFYIFFKNIFFYIYFMYLYFNALHNLFYIFILLCISF